MQPYTIICLDLGYYIYIDTSYSRENDKAVLRSPDIQPSVGSICFMFAYHMYGVDINTLNIYSVIGTKRHRYVQSPYILYFNQLL